MYSSTADAHGGTENIDFGSYDVIYSTALRVQSTQNIETVDICGAEIG